MAALAQLRAVMAGGALALPEGWRDAVRTSHSALAARLAAGEVMYGVNTGFGKLAGTRIPPDALVQLQLNLIRSHASGVGEPLPRHVVRLVLALKALSLSRGASAVREETVEMLLRLLEADVLPVIPARGSVGASGDLAPLAHMSLVLIGEGAATVDGVALPGAEVLKGLGLKPLPLGPKEGLALLNGTQVSTAIALVALFRARDLFATALVAGAMLEQFGVAWETTVQEHVPADKLARVYSYDMVGSFLAVPIGQIAIGPIAAAAGVEATLAGATVLMTLAVLGMLSSRDVRTLRHRLPEQRMKQLAL